MSSDPLTVQPDWDEFRRQMPITARWVYLDHAAVAPIPAPAQQSISDWAEQAARDGATRWPEWDRRVNEVRSLAARMISADENEIALVQNTTAGIGLVAEGFPWQSGDNIVTLANEFPSNLYPWMNLQSHGVETRRVAVEQGRVDLDRIAEACDQRTRIVAASWVGFASGWRNDVAELARVAHDRGALLFLDAIQGLGVFPLDVRQADVDFLAADGHKWMLGPEGAGILFIRREHLDRLRPIGVGWHSVEHDYDFDRIQPDWKPSAARYEGGSANTPGFIGLRSSLELLLGYGADNLGRRILEITDFACQCLVSAGAAIESVRDGEHDSGIVSFTWPHGDLRAIRHQLLDQGIVLSFRGGCLRISPHAYTSEDDIERLVAALKHPA